MIFCLSFSIAYCLTFKGVLCHKMFIHAHNAQVIRRRSGTFPSPMAISHAPPNCLSAQIMFFRKYRRGPLWESSETSESIVPVVPVRCFYGDLNC
jgi:hypothetical protein